VMRYVVPQGFIAVDGASLTVAEAGAGDFTVSLVPFTQQNVTLPERRPGQTVNLEVDIVAKYVERLLFRRTGPSRLTEEFLAEQSRAGVGTILSMHVTEKALEEAKKHHVNMIQCSHMASDALGVNLLLDALQKAERKLEVMEIAGFIRVQRNGTRKK
ncbi:MAG: hypothetical protein AAB728_04810, partial [Patescibacteria group bacterium]